MIKSRISLAAPYISNCLPFHRYACLRSKIQSRSIATEPLIKLRDYQEHAVKNTLESIERGVKRPAVVLATGGGKTVVMSHLIPQIKSQNKGDKVLVLAHKQELVRQAAATIHRSNPDLRVCIDMAKAKPDLENQDVVVASVPTLVYRTRMERYDPTQYKAIILDECHHATAHSWMKILDYFGALEADAKVYTIGFTATLERADGMSLGKVFEEIVFERNLITMIRARELCDVRLSKIEVSIDWSKVRSSEGDFVQKDLSEAVNKEDINVMVTQGYMQLKKKHNYKSTLVFCVDIEHCKTLCGVLQRNGVKAQYVTGETVHHERRAILEDFRNGNIEVLCNVLVFTEGTDIPNIDSLVLARPTQSRSLLIQMIGRGLRLHKQKDVCDVIDMVDATKHGFESTPTLLGMESAMRAAGKSDQEINQTMETLLEDTILHNPQEEARLKKEEQVFRAQKQLSDMEIRFQTIEGFADIERVKGDLQDIAEDINRIIRESRLPWARFAYNQWGITIGSRKFLLQRIEDSTEFEFCEVTFTSMTTLIASGFKASRTQRNVIRRSKSVKELVLAADNMLFSKLMVLEHMKRPASEKQITFIVNKLKSKVESQYGKSTEELTEKLKTWRMMRAANLCFAISLSVNCLWVKWELASLFGYSNETKHRMKRRLNKVDRKLASDQYLPEGPEWPKKPTSDPSTITSEKASGSLNLESAQR